MAAELYLGYRTNRNGQQWIGDAYQDGGPAVDPGKGVKIERASLEHAVSYSPADLAKRIVERHKEATGAGNARTDI